MNIKNQGNEAWFNRQQGVFDMLGFLSFVVVLVILSGTVGLIAATIRNASEKVSAALRGDTRHRVTFLTSSPRPVRRSVPMQQYSAPQRAAA
jgi:hypothetical protein